MDAGGGRGGDESQGGDGWTSLDAENENENGRKVGKGGGNGRGAGAGVTFLELVGLFSDIAVGAPSPEGKVVETAWAGGGGMGGYL